jgi:hypothetical protein
MILFWRAVVNVVEFRASLTNRERTKLLKKAFSGIVGKLKISCT